MKRCILLFLLTFLLVSCGVPPTPAPTATLTPSATILPTSTSTATPEPTLTPTATLDPNAPQGTLGKDDKGVYIEANGVKNRQIELVDPVTGETTTVWAFSATEGEKMIALYDWDEDSNKLGWSDQIRFQFFIDPTVPGAKTFPAMSYIQEVWRAHDDKPVFIGVFAPMLSRSRAINTPGVIHRLQNVVYRFTTSARSFDWAISYGDENDATTIIRRMEDLPLVKGNGVLKIRDPFNGDNYFISKVYSVDGKLVTEIASKISLDKLNDKERAFMAMFGPLSVILSEDQENDVDLSRIDQLVRIAVDGQYPYIVFTPKP